MSYSKHHVRAPNRILLVEDDPVNMKMLDKYLHDDGYISEKANDGVEAWEILEKHTDGFDVVIMDRVMPNMDGLELAKKIKSSSKLQNIPIVMQTSARTVNAVSEGIKAGINYYLAKPYTKEQLITIVKSALRDREKTAEFEARLLRQKNAFSTIQNGEFKIWTPEQAEDIAFILGSLFPRPDLAVMGLQELLMNGIEHGNLNIGSEQKAALLKSDMLVAEVQRRLQLPENQLKRVTVKFSNSAAEIKIRILDEGAGFDWKSYLAPELVQQPLGTKGIAKVNLLSFDIIAYSELGNEVEVSSSFLL